MRVSRMQSIIALVLVAAVMVTSGVEAGPKGDTIVDVALAANAPGGPFAGQLSTLIAALQAADPSVLSTLSGNGQFTVFAPTDQAFANLGLNAGNIAGTFPQETLTQILLYHVARGRRAAADVTSSSQIRTLQRGFLSVSGASLGDLVGRTANIVVTDIEAANGIIHVIDEVVLPFNP
ncbi:MAG: fasciclin domain-containing protein [Candidatus Krumholzibacteria bacterium]|nr:fasciclin domain-containing protein [Candidatus Krumholzibacteria bacterium]